MNATCWVLLAAAAVLSGRALIHADELSDSIVAGEEYDTYSYSSGGRTFRAELPKGRAATDYTPRGFVQQPSFVRGGGTLNKREHAFLLYADGDLIPLPVMLGYRFGVLYWWNAGIDIGANAGVFQAMIRSRMENLKTRKSEAFFWSTELGAGYKLHSIDASSSLRFDDRSVVATIDNSLAYRLGAARRQVLYLLTIFYVDYDLHSPRRQTDYYLTPAMAGFETMVGDRASFFVELGAAYSFNGMEFGDGSRLYERSWFPVMRIGTALRSGGSTAIYYTRETMPLSKGRQPKQVR